MSFTISMEYSVYTLAPAVAVIFEKGERNEQWTHAKIPPSRRSFNYLKN